MKEERRSEVWLVGWLVLDEGLGVGTVGAPWFGTYGRDMRRSLCFLFVFYFFIFSPILRSYVMSHG